MFEYILCIYSNNKSISNVVQNVTCESNIIGKIFKILIIICRILIKNHIIIIL